MRRAHIAWVASAVVALVAAPLTHAQPAPAGKPAAVDGRSMEADQARLLSQQRATAAYREMQQAVFDAKLAEQDVVNTQEAHNAARARADLLKADLDKAMQARDAAKAKEATARKRYDAALDAVPR